MEKLNEKDALIKAETFSGCRVHEANMTSNSHPMTRQFSWSHAKYFNCLRQRIAKGVIN